MNYYQRLVWLQGNDCHSNHTYKELMEAKNESLQTKPEAVRPPGSRCAACHYWGYHALDCKAISVDERLEGYKEALRLALSREDHRSKLAKENFTRMLGKMAVLRVENNALRKTNQKLRKAEREREIMLELQSPSQ